MTKNGRAFIPRVFELMLANGEVKYVDETHVSDACGVVFEVKLGTSSYSNVPTTTLIPVRES